MTSDDPRSAAIRAGHQTIFSHIWRNNIWQSAESRSGPGSSVARTTGFRAALESFLQSINARSLYDAPCGDFVWMQHVKLPPGARYIGADVVPDMIADLQRTHANAERQFIVADIVLDPPPLVDVWLCRECLFHLPLAGGVAAINQWRASQVPYFLATTTPAVTENVDIAPGGWRRLNMEIAPFNLGPADAYLPDAAPADPEKAVGIWRRL
jgi:hypothetical protein